MSSMRFMHFALLAIIILPCQGFKGLISSVHIQRTQISPRNPMKHVRISIGKRITDRQEKKQRLSLLTRNLFRDSLQYKQEEEIEKIQQNLYRDISTRLGEERYSSMEWILAIQSLPKSVIIHRIFPAVFANAVWSGILATINLFNPIRKFPALPHTLLSGALGLLLVFRTNSAFQRFWESRQFWQQITNYSRNLAINLQNNLPRMMHTQAHNLMVALPAALKQHLQGDSDLLRIKPLFTEHDFEKLCDAHNKPLKICKMLSNLINEGFNDERPQKQTLCDSYLGQITFLIGACERVVTTPIPPSYSRHTSRLLTIFCFTLPLVLVQDLGFCLIPVMAIFSWGMMAIDEIGRFIEEPFNAGGHQQLPLEQLIKNLSKDLAMIFDMEPVCIKGKETIETQLHTVDDSHALYERLRYYKDYVYV